MIIHEGITYQLKFLEKMAEKESFLANFFNKFEKKISCNMKISSSVWRLSRFEELEELYRPITLDFCAFKWK